MQDTNSQDKMNSTLINMCKDGVVRVNTGKNFNVNRYGVAPVYDPHENESQYLNDIQDLEKKDLDDTLKNTLLSYAAQYNYPLLVKTLLFELGANPYDKSIKAKIIIPKKLKSNDIQAYPYQVCYEYKHVIIHVGGLIGEVKSPINFTYDKEQDVCIVDIVNDFRSTAYEYSQLRLGLYYGGLIYNRPGYVNEVFKAYRCIEKEVKQQLLSKVKTHLSAKKDDSYLKSFTLSKKCDVALKSDIKLEDSIKNKQSNIKFNIFEEVINDILGLFAGKDWYKHNKIANAVVSDVMSDGLAKFELSPQIFNAYYVPKPLEFIPYVDLKYSAEELQAKSL